MRKQIIQKTKNFIKVGVEVLLGKEDEYFVTYCPALELSSYGITEEEARKNFDAELEIFLEETERRGTLEKILLKLGWSLSHHPEPTYIPPRAPQYSHLTNQSRTFKETISLPL